MLARSNPQSPSPTRIPSSPSLLAITTAAQESPKTFTAVRHMSNGRSIASSAKAAISAFGIPEFFMISKIATRLAEGIPATPMLVSSAANTTTN